MAKGTTKMDNRIMPMKPQMTIALERLALLYPDREVISITGGGHRYLVDFSDGKSLVYTLSML